MILVNSSRNMVLLKVAREIVGVFVMASADGSDGERSAGSALHLLQLSRALPVAVTQWCAMLHSDSGMTEKRETRP